MALKDKLKGMSKNEKGVYLNKQIEFSDDIEDDISWRLDEVKKRRAFLATEFSKN